MSCSCIKKRYFDLNVTSKGCDTMVIEDESVWVGESKPDAFVVNIDIPSRGISKEVTIKTGVKNYFNSIDLLGTKKVKKLPDDIYCFTTESCGYTLTINRAFLCSLETSINRLISKYSIERTDKSRTKLLTFILDLKSIYVNAIHHNIDTAKALFKKLKETLKNEQCDVC